MIVPREQKDKVNLVYAYLKDEINKQLIGVNLRVIDVSTGSNAAYDWQPIIRYLVCTDVELTERDSAESWDLIVLNAEAVEVKIGSRDDPSPHSRWVFDTTTISLSDPQLIQKILDMIRHQSI